MKLSIVFIGLALVLPAAMLASGEQDKAGQVKVESFDRDPNWEGHNNRIRVAPESAPEVTQDFGFSRTNFAGGAAGELGGQITRASKPAYYADKIGPITLDEKLSASGTFALTQTSAGA